eukprot:TRINITY_DN18640_c0_g1_i1.p1 TRINITY_DN18640_c0_g1~~TRINITY_DN18640_c0_g1_i1.p1  ORF type:complete len:233 (-),score=4.36 TRINITY_DN18640_c0_g1_i1:80-778(-)
MSSSAVFNPRSFCLALKQAYSAAGTSLLRTMTVSAETIEQKLRDKLNAQDVKVVDTSGGCGASFSIEVVSREFAGKKLIQRHRAINAALKDEIAQIHALQIAKCDVPPDDQRESCPRAALALAVHCSSPSCRTQQLIDDVGGEGLQRMYMTPSSCKTTVKVVRRTCIIVHMSMAGLAWWSATGASDAHDSCQQTHLCVSSLYTSKQHVQCQCVQACLCVPVIGNVAGTSCRL